MKNPLIRRPHVKRFVLELSQKNRNGKFTRVGQEFYDRAEAQLKQWLVDAVFRHPSVGKTLK